MNVKVQRPQRAIRKPLHQRGPLSIMGDKDPNFAYRFVNDTGARLANYQAAGWEIVTNEGLEVGDSRAKDASDLDSAKRVTGDNGTVSFLMKIKKEYYEEDRAAKQAQAEQQEKALKTETSQKADYGKLQIT